jgi:hypothetical protein
LTPDMHTTRVHIPGVSDSVIVAGATADKLLILGKWAAVEPNPC